MPMNENWRKKSKMPNLKKIVIDPITRIEGHLRAEVEIDEEGIVKEAYVSGQLFRGIETS